MCIYKYLYKLLFIWFCISMNVVSSKNRWKQEPHSKFLKLICVPVGQQTFQILIIQYLSISIKYEIDQCTCSCGDKPCKS